MFSHGPDSAIPRSAAWRLPVLMEVSPYGRAWENGQTVCKPGSVRPCRHERDGHSSGTPVAVRLARPTRTAGGNARGRRRRGIAPTARPSVPIRSCSRWGLPCRPRYRRRGALLPHPFTLAGRPRPAVCSLWHFPWGHPRRALPGTVFPWSPDFPPPAQSRERPSDRLAAQ